MFHFPMEVWHKAHYGSWHLHGHCVDLETDILTKQGWKRRSEIKEGDGIVSFNIESRKLEDDVISELIDIDYSGNVVVGDGKSTDFRFTEEHTVVIENQGSNKISKIKAKEFLNKNKFSIFTSGLADNPGLGLSEDMLKLYILLVADGNIKWETELCRLMIHKERKIKYIRTLLDKMEISYNHHVHESGCNSFNFYLPNELKDFNIKGLDSKLLSANEKDAAAIFEAYEFSDGYRKQGAKTLIIYSAKEQEIDWLQAMFTQNGYHTNKYSRYHGFGENLQHQLSVTKKQKLTFGTGSVKLEQVQNEHFWCIKSRNQTWVMRRNGVVQITGNCHGSLENSSDKRLDVGLDSAYNFFGKHRMFHFDDVAEIMKDRFYESKTHHTTRKGEF